MSVHIGATIVSVMIAAAALPSRLRGEAGAVAGAGLLAEREFFTDSRWAAGRANYKA
jgi:hypothetical protein